MAETAYFFLKVNILKQTDVNIFSEKENRSSKRAPLSKFALTYTLKDLKLMPKLKGSHIN